MVFKFCRNSCSINIYITETQVLVLVVEFTIRQNYVKDSLLTGVLCTPLLLFGFTFCCVNAMVFTHTVQTYVDC